MGGIYLIIPAIILILISFLVVTGASVALMMTGMDGRKARFQALSAFTGTGFTTRESDLVVNHPQRRRIITWLMILGNAGFVTIIVTATSSIITSSVFRWPIIIPALFSAGYGVYRLSRRRGFMQKWEKFVERRIAKSPIVEESNIEDLLHLIEGYGLIRAIVTKDSPLAGITLSEIRHRLPASELLVLGIERGKSWIPIPKADETIAENDRLVVYGHLNILRERFMEASQ